MAEPGLRRTSRMAAQSSLNAGLLDGREHEFIICQRLSFPHPFVQVQDPTCFGREVRITREDPAAVLPWTDGILMEPTPHGAVPDGGHNSPSHFCSHLADAEPRQRQTTLAR